MNVPLLVGAVALYGCVTLRVNMDYDREADFAVYGDDRPLRAPISAPLSPSWL